MQALQQLHGLIHLAQLKAGYGEIQHQLLAALGGDVAGLLRLYQHFLGLSIVFLAALAQQHHRPGQHIGAQVYALRVQFLISGAGLRQVALLLVHNGFSDFDTVKQSHTSNLHPDHPIAYPDSLLLSMQSAKDQRLFMIAGFAFAAGARSGG